MSTAQFRQISGQKYLTVENTYLFQNFKDKNVGKKTPKQTATKKTQTKPKEKKNRIREKKKISNFGSGLSLQEITWPSKPHSVLPKYYVADKYNSANHILNKSVQAVLVTSRVE